MTHVQHVEGWYVNGVRLEDYGVILETRDGWDDVPGMIGDNIQIVGQHGAIWRKKRYDVAKKTLTIVVNGTTTASNDTSATTWQAQRALYEEALDTLLRLLAPRHELLELVRVHANGERRRAYAEITSPIVPTPIGNTAGRIQVDFVIPGPFWEDYDATGHNVGYDTVVGGSQNLEVYSLAGQTAPCTDAIITATGPFSTLTITDVETGSGFVYDSALLVGESLIVTCGEFTATVGGYSVITDFTLNGQNILELSPASAHNEGPYVTINTVTCGAGFSVSFSTKRKWLR